MENSDEKSCGMKGRCPCLCHKAIGLLITAIGVVFLLGALNVLTPHCVELLWPILVILIGLKKTFGKGMCKCCVRG